MDFGIYKNKVAIVTGAASGIGKALSELLIKSGAKVILVDLNGAPLEAEAEKLGKFAQAKTADVTSASQIKQVVDFTVNKYGRLDYIFNNAGLTVIGEVRDISIEDWNKVLNVDINGVVDGVVAAYPVMVKQGFGHIVNTSSMAGFVPMVIEVPYVAAKYAVVGLSHALRMEGKRLGVKVSVVCPSAVNTPIFTTSAVKINKVNKALDFLTMFGLAPKLLPPEKAAEIILRGVAKNRATILTDFISRLAWYCYRLSPDFWMWFYEAYTMKKYRSMRKA